MYIRTNLWLTPILCNCDSQVDIALPYLQKMSGTPKCLLILKLLLKYVWSWFQNKSGCSVLFLKNSSLAKPSLKWKKAAVEWSHWSRLREFIGWNTLKCFELRCAHFTCRNEHLRSFIYTDIFVGFLTLIRVFLEGYLQKLYSCDLYIQNRNVPENLEATQNPRMSVTLPLGLIV